MAAIGPYDNALQMFIQTSQPIDMSKLAFLRWLAERGRLEHRIAGPSSGEFVARRVAMEAQPIAVSGNVAEGQKKGLEGGKPGGPEYSGR